jgi:hypothetical protein
MQMEGIRIFSSERGSRGRAAVITSAVLAASEIGWEVVGIRAVLAFIRPSKNVINY